MSRRALADAPTGESDEIVSGVHASRRRPGEAVVSFESGARIRLPIDHESTLSLRSGQTISADDVLRLRAVSDFETARAYALRALAARMLGSVELERRLRRRGHSGDAVAAVVQRCVEFGLIDDEAFAAATARSLVLGKPAGARLIEQKLCEKGVARALARSLAAEVAPPEEEAEVATAFAERRVASIRASARDPQAVRRRLAGALARRGFSPDVCRRAVEAVLSDDG